MDRRHLLAAAPLLALSPVMAATQGKAKAKPAADPHAGHTHGAASGDAAMHESCMPNAHGALIGAFQGCMTTVLACIAHCQMMMAQGDKSMAPCLRTALDTEVVCGATLKAAQLNSAYTGALAKTAIEAMQACVKACAPHVDHHIECKRCHDACLAAIAAARQLG